MNKDKLYGFIKFYPRAKVVFKLFVYHYKFKKTVTLAAKAALEIHKQISKSTQSPATTGGVSGLKKVPGV
jgi:hypothetical protein